jgi:hypothetical protein
VSQKDFLNLSFTLHAIVQLTSLSAGKATNEMRGPNDPHTRRFGNQEIGGTNERWPGEPPSRGWVFPEPLSVTEQTRMDSKTGAIQTDFPVCLFVILSIAPLKSCIFMLILLL